MPSPIVGSGVDVRHTVRRKSLDSRLDISSCSLALYILERKYSKAIELSAIAGDCEIESDGSPRAYRTAIHWRSGWRNLNNTGINWGICIRIFHDCCTESYGQVSRFKYPSSKGTRTFQKNLQSHVWRLPGIIIWHKMVIAMTDWNISIVHCCVSFGTGGGCATWKSTRTLETERCTSAKNRKTAPRKGRALMNGSERQLRPYKALLSNPLPKPPGKATICSSWIFKIHEEPKRCYKWKLVSDMVQLFDYVSTVRI